MLFLVKMMNLKITNNMKVETKYNVKDSVFVLYKHKIINVEIHSFQIEVDKDSTVVKCFYTIDGDSQIVEEPRVFSSRQALIDSL